MAVCMWRMNGLWKTAGVLVLCALLLSNEVICQDDEAADATDAPTAGPDDVPDDGVATAAPAAATEATAAPDAGADPTPAAGEESATSAAAAAGDSTHPFTVQYVDVTVENQDGGTPGSSGTTAGPTVKDEVAAPADGSDDFPIVPDVQCVGQDDISESNAVKVEVATADCEETRRIILESPEGWCQKTTCDLKIFQDDKTALVASDTAMLSALAQAFQREPVKNQLGVTKIETPPPSSSSSSSGSSVFVGILVSGLLAALAITVGYFKCQRRSETKGVRLAEEAYPVDQENQGNTLVSVAPLNPPPDTQEKPSANGESNEAAKTQPPPPTNGHSTTKTADTEM